MTSRVNQTLKTEANKFKGEEKERHTIRRNGNLDCDSRQRLAALVTGNSVRATLEFEETAQFGDVFSVRKPCDSHGALSHQRMHQQFHKLGGDVVCPLMTSFQCMYLCVFYTIIAFRRSSHTTCKR